MKDRRRTMKSSLTSVGLAVCVLRVVSLILLVTMLILAYSLPCWENALILMQEEILANNIAEIAKRPKRHVALSGLTEKSFVVEDHYTRDCEAEEKSRKEFEEAVRKMPLMFQMTLKEGKFDYIQGPRKAPQDFLMCMSLTAALDALNVQADQWDNARHAKECRTLHKFLRERCRYLQHAFESSTPETVQGDMNEFTKIKGSPRSLCRFVCKLPNVR